MTMKMSFKEYFKKNEELLYGVMGKYSVFYAGKGGKELRLEVLSEGTIKLGELFNEKIDDEKLIYYRLLDHIDKYVVRNTHFKKNSMNLSDYHMLSYRSLLKKESDVRLWTLEWILEQEYRGKFTIQRAELMLELAKLNTGAIHHIGSVAEKEDHEFLNPQTVVNFTSNIELDWLEDFCKNEEDKRIIKAIVEGGVYSRKKISEYLGHEKTGKVKYFLNRLRKELKEQGITAEKFKEFHLQETSIGRIIGITAE